MTLFACQSELSAHRVTVWIFLFTFLLTVAESVIKASRVCAGGSSLYARGIAIEAWARACDLLIGRVICTSTRGLGNRAIDLFLVAHNSMRWR